MNHGEGTPHYILQTREDPQVPCGTPGCEAASRTEETGRERWERPGRRGEETGGDRLALGRVASHLTLGREKARGLHPPGPGADGLCLLGGLVEMSRKHLTYLSWKERTMGSF